MNLVLDVDAAIALSSGSAPQTILRAVSGAPRVLVPALYDFEVANVVWKYFEARHWDAEECATVLEQSLAWPDDRILGFDLAVEALSLAREHHHPAYDMFYVVLARRSGSVLATLDKQLARVAKKLDIDVVDARP